MDDTELKQDRAIIDAATPGPWRWGDSERRENRMNLYGAHSRIGEGFPILWLDKDSWAVTALHNTAFIEAARTRWPAALDEIDRLRQADDFDHRGILVDKLKAEIEAMRPVVEAAVGYCLAPSACWQSEARLVEAAGLYHANRRMSENAPVLEASVVRTGHFAMGAECSSCGHQHAGADVGHICIGCPCEERPVDIAESA